VVRGQQLRFTIEASREAVRLAHERARAATERARRIRADIRHRRESGGYPDRTRGALRLAEEESTRAICETERFIAVVSHELRQPVNAALAANALIDAGPDTPAAARARQVLGRQLQHMSTLLNDLLDMSRLSIGSMDLQTSPIDVRTVMQDALDAIETAAEHAGVHLYVKLPASPAVVAGDAGRLQQVFSNVLTNALRHTPRGGSVNVIMAVEDIVVAITVADTGQGIAAEDLGSIFDPFWRGGDSGSEGFGIGLALVRGIVEMHGGSIAAFSEGRDTGSRFCLTLPLARP
jgi:signal transduction histidine kinase